MKNKSDINLIVTTIAGLAVILKYLVTMFIKQIFLGLELTW